MRGKASLILIVVALTGACARPLADRVRIVGNTHFPELTLRTALRGAECRRGNMAGRAGFELGYARLGHACRSLDGLAATIEAFYGEHGYLQAEVQAVYPADVRISAGPLFHVRDVSVEVDDVDYEVFSLTPEALRAAVPIHVGDPFSRAAMRAGVAAIEDRLHAGGYDGARVQPLVSVGEDALVSVSFAVSRGPASTR
jgi:outer membrane protein assembly factor BamA